MTKERQMCLVSRFGLTTALVAASFGLMACTGYETDSGFEDVDEAESAVGPTGNNNIPPSAYDSDSLARPITNSAGITSPANPDPMQLCMAGTVSPDGCIMKPEWENWLEADPDNRAPMMLAIAKCAVSSSFVIEDATGVREFAGQWNLYPSWKTNRLTGVDKRERMTSCMLSLVNGNNETLDICIIGPGGGVFDDPCTDPSMTIREGGFFGNLFTNPPTAYVAGPDTSEVLDNGRVCNLNGTNYCCPEEDTSCQHRIVITGAILGSPEQNFANKRCNGTLVDSGGNEYCTSYFSTREPNKSYTNVFTTFVPPVPAP